MNGYSFLCGGLAVFFAFVGCSRKGGENISFPKVIRSSQSHRTTPEGKTAAFQSFVLDEAPLNSEGWRDSLLAFAERTPPELSSESNHWSFYHRPPVFRILGWDEKNKDFDTREQIAEIESFEIDGVRCWYLNTWKDLQSTGAYRKCGSGGLVPR